MLRLNLATDFALRLLLYLAVRPGGWVSARAVAAFYGISADHVSKVAQVLTQAGYLRAERGRSGGLQLARAPEAISVGEIVELFEGPVSLLECVVAESVCVLQPACRLRQVLERAGARLIQELKEVRLSDLVAPGALDSPEAAPLVQLSLRPERVGATRAPATTAHGTGGRRPAEEEHGA